MNLQCLLHQLVRMVEKNGETVAIHSTRTSKQNKKPNDSVQVTITFRDKFGMVEGCEQKKSQTIGSIKNYCAKCIFGGISKVFLSQLTLRCL